jgi:DNA mismatch repair protein MutS2
MQLLPEDTLEKLEFTKIAALVEGDCQGERGRQLATSLRPSASFADIERQLDRVAEFRRGREEQKMFTIGAYEEVDEELRSLRIPGYVLVQSGLAKLNVLLRQAKLVFEYFQSGPRQDAFPSLFTLLHGIGYEVELSSAIEAVIDVEGNIRSDASEELARIRRLTASKQREVEKAFRSVIEKYRRAGYLTDTVESFRNGRRVLSVPSEYKRQIRGIIHDESATGKTAYIEPDEVISINNDIFDLLQEERREIHRILQQLSDRLRPHVESIQSYYELLGQLDLVQAKAALARWMRAARPKLHDRPGILIHGGRHPLLYLKNKRLNKETIPFNLTLRGKSRILMLSGPNAGGKSIAMKAVGLLQLMVQSGLLVPVDEDSEFGIFGSVFTDIGDQQSIEDDLSTYSGRLKNAREFLRAADECSLVLIDEFGSGTDPASGGAIAEGVLDGLNYRKVHGVITTHYSNLKIYAYQTSGIVNGGMHFDKDTLSPTYELNVGRPGSSYAFEIAQKSGLSRRVLDYARKRAGKNERAVDQLLVDLQREKQEAEERLERLKEKQKTLDALTRTYEELHRDIEVRRKRLKLEAKEQSLAETAKYNKEMERLVRELREEKKIEQAKETAKNLRKERDKISEQVTDLRESIYYQPKHGKGKKKSFAPGDHVKLRTGTTAGVIETIDRKRATLIVNDLRMTVPLRDLEHTADPLVIRDQRSVSNNVAAVASFSNKLDVRGMRYEEVLKTTQAFVDQALLSNASQLRIVHGKGSGALRRAVRQTLNEYNHDFELSTPPREQGGEGVTIVDL